MNTHDFILESADSNQETGDFGPIFRQFKHNATGAIAKLKDIKNGEAIAALHHPDVGDIDLVWGVAGTSKSDGHGLSKLVAFHPEVLNDLQGILSGMTVVMKSANRVRLESEKYIATVRLEWNGKAKQWLLTAFEKRVGAGTTTDTSSIAIEDDTARLKTSPLPDSNIPLSPAEVKNEDIVTESATFDPRAAIQAATSYKDIENVFRRMWPVLIPADTVTPEELRAQGFTVDTNINGAIISLRMTGNIALRNRAGVWKLYEGEVDEKNLIEDVFTLQEVVTEMKGMVLESSLTTEEVHEAAHEAATSHLNDLPEPTEAQAKAGNYKHGHLKLYDLDITIENPAGSKRSGIDPNGKPWESTIPAHYGYFLKSEGSDGDHVDCYIGENPESECVFVVDQMCLMTGCFDEHKVILSSLNEAAARKIYTGGFSDGRGADRIGAITEMNMDEFKGWLTDGETTQPVGRVTMPDRGRY
jgi:hypothetical protein